MNVIEKIKIKLEKYPQVIYEETENSISVLPTSENGFTVSIQITEDSSKVFFNGWHEDFKNDEEALNCFAFGLSTSCRLKEFYKNGKSCKWILEHKVNNVWVSDGTTGVFNFAFWEKETSRYLQNDLIK